MADNEQPHLRTQRSLGYRAGAGLRAGSDKAYGWFRRWLAKIWKVRGGGLYASGFIVTLLYLEVTTFVSELSESTGVGDFFREQLIEFIMRFSVESLTNMLEAFLWPLKVIAIAPPWGAIGLGVGYFAFQRFLNEPIERWLIGDEE